MGGKAKMRYYRTQGRWGVSECSGHPIFVFFIKENWICAMTRHHAEPKIKDDDDDDEEKGVLTYFQPGLLSEILIIAEPEFRLS